MDDYGVDLDEIKGVIERAEVLVVRFQAVEKRLLIDFRTSSSAGPMAKAVAPAGSVDERFRTMRLLRPTFSPPQRILSFLWPRGLASFERSGVLEAIRNRVVEIGTETDAGMIREAFGELLTEERATLSAAIRGGEGFQTLWDRSSANE